jgi:hypothetical protein
MRVQEKSSDKKEERKKERKVRNFYYLKLCTGDDGNKRKICGREEIYQLPVSRNRGLGNTVYCKPSSLTSSYLGAEIIRVTDLPGSVPTFDCRTL